MTDKVAKLMENIPKEMLKYREKFEQSKYKLETKNIRNFEDRDNQQEFPKDSDIKDICSRDPITYKIDPNSVKIKTIKWYQNEDVVRCLLLEFRNGKKTPLFGNNNYQPNNEYTLPEGSTIAKVDFHQYENVE